MNKNGILKTTIKSMIALLVFSSVLEISSRTLENYLIFVGIWLIITLLYELYKYSTRYSLTERGVLIKSPIRTNLVAYPTIKEVFKVQGYLQKKFGLASVYVVTQKGVIAVRDLTDGNTFLEQVRSRIGKK